MRAHTEHTHHRIHTLYYIHIHIYTYTYAYTSSPTGFQTVIREEGVRGLWRGNTVNVLRMIPNKGVLHATNDLYKDFARNLAVAVPAVAACGTGMQLFVSGSLAGMTSVAAT